MARFRLATVALLLIVGPALAADPVKWGPVADGLKMSITITGNITDANAKLEVIVRNVSNEPILFQLGSILNHRTPVLWFRALVTTPDGNERTVVSGPAKLVGSFQVSPLAVELIPDASYEIERPLTEWEDWSGPTDLKALLSKPCRLRVELNAVQEECPLGNAENTVFPCWRGKLVSNVLELPN